MALSLRMLRAEAGHSLREPVLGPEAGKPQLSGVFAGNQDVTGCKEQGEKNQ